MSAPKYKVVSRPMNTQNLGFAGVAELLNTVAGEAEAWEFVQMVISERSNEVLYIFKRP